MEWKIDSEEDFKGEKKFSLKNIFQLKSAIIIFIFLILANLIYLDLISFKNRQGTVIQNITNVNPSSAPTQQGWIGTIDQSCPVTCLSKIYEATSSSKPSQETKTSTPVTIPVSSAKEFFVSFGSGSNSSDDWQDVVGLKASIDSNNYSNIKSVVFEASVHIPTGNETAYIRLFNVTDKHPVWFSDVSMEGGSPQFLTSQNIILDSGSKIYQVQMKTSLKFPAILDQSRLHIITR